jgi:uncharacterized protein
LFLFAILSAVLVSHYLKVQSSSDDELFIKDNAHIFSAVDMDDISSYHRMMLEKYDIDYRILTTRESDAIDIYAHKIFTDEKIGNRSQAFRGLLLVIDTSSDQVRLEVSGNLESVFTDGFVGYIERRQMVPFFRLGRVGDGIFATSELLRTRAEEAKQGKAFDPSQFKGSLGGGAGTKADINAGRDTTFSTGRDDVTAADTPEESLRRMLLAMKNRNARSDLDVYTPEARQYMAGMVVSPAQMDNVAKRYQECELDRVVYSDDGKRAVLLHDLTNRACDPFTFDKGEDGKWRINLKAIGSGLGHTYGNAWYLHYGRQKESGLHKYYFGFRDYRFWRPEGEQFDHQGFPYYYRWGVYMNHVYQGSEIQKIHGEDSYAAKIGLQPGDLILRWEGREYPHNGTIHHRMGAGKAGLDVDIVLLRDGKKHHMIVEVPPRPEQGKLRWGVTHRSPGPRIPLVHHVTPKSQGEKLGLKSGDLIVSWNDIDMPLTRTVYKQMREAQPGARVTAEVLRNGGKVRLTGIVAPQRAMAKVE